MPPDQQQGLRRRPGWQQQRGAGTTSWVKLWAAPTFDSDWPCLPKELQLHLQQAGELSFQRSAQKRLSLWTKRLHPYIKGEARLTLGSHNASLRPKPGRKCWALNSFFPKQLNVRSSLYHDTGNRTVSGVCLILLNRWQILVNAYVHNYVRVLSTVWLNESDNILVRCLVLSSVWNINMLFLSLYERQNIKHGDRKMLPC